MDNDLSDNNEFRKPGEHTNISGRQFGGRVPRGVVRPSVFLQPSIEAQGVTLGASWKTTPVGIGRPTTPNASSYIRPVVL